MKHKKSIFKRFRHWLESADAEMILFIVAMFFLIVLAMAMEIELPIMPK